MFRHLNSLSSIPAAPSTGAATRGANRLTGVRQEIKFLLPQDVAERVMAAVQKSIPAKIVDGKPFSHRVSAYLDVPDRELTRQGLARGSQALKLRVKEYYHVDEGVLHVGPRCWLEVKARLGTMVEKSRFVVDRECVLETLRNGPASNDDPEARTAIESFEAVRRGRPLVPVIVAHYTRWTFQDPDSRMRITLDKGTSFHIPPRGLYTPKLPTGARVNLPPPLEMENRWIMEVKSIGPSAPWLEEALAGIEPADYSKFVAGLRAAERRGLLPV